MNSSNLIELGKISKIAQDKLLIEHSAHNIPPLGVKVGYFEENSAKNLKDNKLKSIGKIIDIIGSVKRPVILIKLENKSKKIDKDNYVLFYQKEVKKKGYKKKAKYQRKKK